MMGLCKMVMIMSVIVLIQISCSAAQSYTNITIGASLAANATNSTWSSPSGEFAFGFRQVSPGGGYLLAIWFDRIPEKTIVWSANRDDPAPEGSTVQLARDGRLELNDPRGQEIWAAAPAAAAAYAAVLDTGNLVLADATSDVLWQSYDYPTDTLLPSQTMNRGNELISGFSAANYSKGRFLFTMQTDGNLVWYTRNFPMDDPIEAYLATGTVGSGFRFIFNQSGFFNLVAQNGTVLSHLFDNIGASTEQYYQRLTLEDDGVLRHYLYPKSADRAGGRAMAWSVYAFLPSNICTQIRQAIGGGACGINSFCSLQTDQRPQCGCPSGYSLFDPLDSRSGCKPDFIRQSCDIDQESEENDLFSFNDMPDTDWPDSDYAYFRPVTEEWCRRDCLTDCLCDVAIFRDSNCWKKRAPLSNGKNDPGVQGKALIKVRRRNGTAPPNPSRDDQPIQPSRSRNTRSGLIIAGSVLLGSSVFVNILLFASMTLFVCRFNGRKSIATTAEEAGERVYPGVNVRCFTFNELQEATDGFREELGNGAYSTVFKGTLREENGKVVAVKRLDRIVSEADEEFKAEVSSISRTNHKNLVRLLGYCDEGQHRLLVYEFMSNGTLAHLIFQNSTKPSFYTRVQIAFAVARGLCYLHEECSTQIIHCDIKPQNVLLDDSHTAKISDFGLAKLLRADQTRTTTGIRGTRGYVAPEWFKNMRVTVKVDVYSYGVMLLELLCCRRNYEPEIEDNRKQILADWAYDCYNGARLDLLVDDDGEMADDVRRLQKLVKIALWCIQEDPELRPKMSRVVLMLEGSTEVPPPPDPASAI